MPSPSPSSLLITGLGAYSAAGENVPTLWQNVLSKNISISKQTCLNSGKQLPVYRAQTPFFFGKQRALVQNADRSSQLALAAASEAWKMAQLPETHSQPERVGVIVGSARGPSILQEEIFVASRIKPTASLYNSFSSTAGILSNAFHTEGMAHMVSSSCTSGATALQIAAQMIHCGILDIALVGATEAPLSKSILKQYQAIGIVSSSKNFQESLKPFDISRSGTVLGEGAAFIILESEASAKRRQVSPLGILKSISLRTQSRHRTGLDRKGTSLHQVLQHSLEEASLSLEEVSFLHLHGTGTRLNDLLESEAIASFFGPIEKQPYAMATKAITGHTLGAAALFQVILSLCALREEKIPQVANCFEQDPECPIRISRTSLSQSFSTALSLTSGFWGNVSSIIVGKE